MRKLIILLFLCPFLNSFSQTVSTVVGNGNDGFGGDGGAALNALIRPSKTIVDKQGNIYIAEYWNYRVRRVDAKTGIITTVAGNGLDGTSFLGDGGQAINAGMQPTDICLDADGNLYIVDYKNYRIRRVNAATGIINTIAGIGYNSQPENDGVPAATSYLPSPLGICFDGSGSLYIAMTTKIRRINLATGLIYTVVGTGVQSYTGDGGPATLATVYQTTSVCTDKVGDLYLNDSYYSVVRKVSKATGIITTIAGIGSSGYSGDGGSALNARISPSTIAADTLGNIYIAESINRRIRKILKSSGIIYTIGGNGSSVYVGENLIATQTGFSGPDGISVDDSCNVFFNDYGLHRVFKIKNSLASVFVVDPNPSLVNDQGALINDVSKIDLDKKVVGAVTDGVTKVLLVIPSSSALRFSISSLNDGTLSSLDNQTTQTSDITIQPNNGRVVAVYTVPDGLGANNPENQKDVSVNISVASNPALSSVTKLKLVTPPVVLIHGMWSDPSIWNKGGENFVKYFDTKPKVNLYLVDYKNDNFRTFDPADDESISSRLALLSKIEEALYEYRNSFLFAATQVDVVAHSLGGLITRSLAATSPTSSIKYFNLDNYKKGYVHKLITLGTPHKGSPLGPVLVKYKDKTIINFLGFKETVSDLLDRKDMKVGTAHSSFQENSIAFKNLGASPPFKTFAIVGDHKGDPGLGIPSSGGKPILNALIQFVVTGGDLSLDQIFKTPCAPGDYAINYDLIVGANSQTGGILKNKVFMGTAHSAPGGTTETNSPLIMDEVYRLLMSNIASDFSIGFPDPTTISTNCVNGRVTDSISTPPFISNKVRSVDPPYIKISSPSNGITLNQNSNATIRLEFTALNGAYPVGSLIVFNNNTNWMLLPSATAPFFVDFTIPKNSPVGKIGFSVLALDSSGIVMGDTGHIVISPAGTFDSLFASPTSIHLDSVIRKKSIYVTGIFHDLTDTITNDITLASSGIKYKSQKNETIFKVDSNGNITAVSPGLDTLVINFSTRTIKVPVVVAANFSLSSFYTNTIDFPLINDRTLNAAPFGLSATATSGDNVSFSFVSGPASITNGIVTFTNTGKITVKASQNGNSYFAPAADVTRTFCIKPKQPFITQNSNKLLSNTSVGNQWYLNGVPVVGATDSVYIPISSGNYTLSISENGCTSDLSAPITYLITSLNDIISNNQIAIYPNPVNNQLTVINNLPNHQYFITIYDMMGKILFKSESFQNKKEVDFSRLANAIYIVDIKDSKNKLIVRKMIVKQ